MISKKVIHLAGEVRSAMEGAFQLSATADDVMPKNYSAETILGLVESKVL